MATRHNLYFIVIASLVFTGLGCKPPGVRALFKGEKLLHAGDTEAAVIEFEKAVRNLPQEWRAWNYLGLARHQAGDLSQAGEAYQEAMKNAGERCNSPNDLSFVLYFNRGRLNLDRGHLADAQLQLHTFASQKQTFKSLFWLAEAFRQNGDMLQAEKTYLLALDKNNNSPVAHNRLGLVQLKLNNPVKAIARFQKALELQPKFDQAQLNLALTYHLYTPADYPNREVLALEAFKTYIKKISKPATGVQKMMDALQAKLAQSAPPFDPSENTNKLELVRDFPSQFPVDPPAPVDTNSTVAFPLTNLVAGLPSNEDTEAKAVSELHPSTKADDFSALPETEETSPSVDAPALPVTEGKPKALQTTSLLGQSVPIVVPEMPGVARYKYLKPVRPEPKVVEDPRRLKALFEKAYHQYRIKEFDKAIAGYRHVLEIDPAHQQAYVNIAIAMQVAGSVKASLPEYEKALAINPLSQPAREGFASALNQSGFFIDAAVEFHKLSEVHRDNVPANLGLGVLYAQHLNRPDKAEYYYRRVLELNPQHTEAANIRRWLYNKSQ